MSKKDKLRSKLFATPPPKGFSWDELITVLTQAGFSNSCTGGSHYMFEHSDGLRLSMSKTHPSGILKPYQVKDAKEAIVTIEAEIARKAKVAKEAIERSGKPQEVKNGN